MTPEKLFETVDGFRKVLAASGLKAEDLLALVDNFRSITQPAPVAQPRPVAVVSYRPETAEEEESDPDEAEFAEPVKTNGSGENDAQRQARLAQLMAQSAPKRPA